MVAQEGPHWSYTCEANLDEGYDACLLASEQLIALCDKITLIMLVFRYGNFDALRGYF